MTLYPDRTSVPFNHPVNSGQTKACPLGLGGEERFENPLLIFGQNALSGIRNRDFHLWAMTRLPRFVAPFHFSAVLVTILSQIRLQGAYGEFQNAALGHGVKTIDCQVPENLLELIPIGLGSEML